MSYLYCRKRVIPPPLRILHLLFITESEWMVDPEVFDLEENKIRWKGVPQIGVVKLLFWIAMWSPTDQLSKSYQVNYEVLQVLSGLEGSISFSLKVKCR